MLSQSDYCITALLPALVGQANGSPPTKPLSRSYTLSNFGNRGAVTQQRHH
nr:hypothetical protein [Bacteroides caecimuris]